MKFPLSDWLTTAIFVVCLATAAAGGMLAVMTTRIIRSVCGLAICCFGLAGLYYFLNSPFLALMEILIYVGAVCVTIVFAVMLSEPDEPAAEGTRRATLLWAGLAIGIAGAVFVGLYYLGSSHAWVHPAARVTDGSIKAIGIALLTTYSLPFEMISLALLAAIIGALAIARTGRTKP